MQRVNMLKYFGVTPYIVFDGDFLPSKAGTEASREKRREECRKTGMELLKAGKQAQAHAELQKAIDITPEMARHLIEELKAAGVQYVVAPYEADAQLVYLERQGLINGIISEDSDILVFGAKRLLTKLGPHGECVEINRRDFCAVREVSLTGWSDTEFRHMAIFSGCDYLDGINNVGLKTAHRLIRKYKTPERVVRSLQFEGKHRIPENYLASFKQAEHTFIYQRVFCPTKKDNVLLTEPDANVNVEDMPFIGAHVDTELARAIALGDANPITKKPILISTVPEKRRSSQSLGAPPAAAVQTRSAGKPIDSYFKGHRRIPLGEMDPNCFAVKPRQSASPMQDGLAPSIFPLPRPYIEGDQPAPATSNFIARNNIGRSLRRHTEPVSNLLGLAATNPGSDARRTSAGVLPSAQQQQAISSARPLKKPRLCEDLPMARIDHQTPEKSKFFSPSSSKSSAKRPEIVLRSDDSIEEALLSLPDIDGWESSKSRKGAKKIRIFEESPRQREEASDRDIEEPTASPSKPLAEETQEQEGPPKSSAMGIRQFAYTPNLQHARRDGTQFAHGLPTPASSIRVPSPTRTPPTVQSSLPTPLQRLGARALRTNGSATPPATPNGPGLSAGKRRSFSTFPVNPAFVPLPKVDMAEVEALHKSGGSEDLIIPDSDDENDAELDQGENEGLSTGSRLNLSRFLFS